MDNDFVGGILRCSCGFPKRYNEPCPVCSKRFDDIVKEYLDKYSPPEECPSRRSCHCPIENHNDYGDSGTVCPVCGGIFK